MDKQDLINYRFLCKEVEQLKEKIIELQIKILEPKNQIITDMPRGTSAEHDKIGAVIAKLDELQKQYIEKYADLVSQQNAIERAINKLNSRERTLMRYRYFDNYSWQQIADEMDYSIEAVYKIHRHILEDLKSVQFCTV